MTALDDTPAHAFVRTLSGNLIDLLDLQETDILLHDIAVPLAKICRYGARLNLDLHLSVAEHSVLVSRIARWLSMDDASVAFIALMHDASEAYISDVVAPLKPHIGGFEEIETRIQSRIHEAFGIRELPERVTKLVTMADKAALALEMKSFGDESYLRYSGYLGIAESSFDERGIRVRFLNPKNAHDLFLNEYDRCAEDLFRQGY